MNMQLSGDAGDFTLLCMGKRLPIEIHLRCKTTCVAMRRVRLLGLA